MKAVAMRRFFVSVLLLAGGLVVEPGTVSADAGEAASPSLRVPMSRLASGRGFSCRVLDSGHVTCWGLNTAGQLGNGYSDVSSTEPVLVSDISTATAVSIGSSHACALLQDTSVKCWGLGTSGQLGNGSNTSRPSPVAVCADSGCTTPLTGVTALSLGYQSSCALLAAGTVSCWGDNSNWQLGADPDTSVTTSTHARNVPGLSGVKMIGAGEMHVCAVVADDTVKCWGLGSSGQLGNGAFSNAGPTSVSLAGVSTVSAVIGGYGYTCVVKKSDSVVGCWGSNWKGQTGSGTGTMYEASLVTPQIGGVDVKAKAISVSGENTCVVTDDDQVACWGGYLNGGTARPTGFGNTFYARELLSGSAGATAVAVGDRHGCIIVTDGTMKCWGRNELNNGDGAGALANGSTVNSLTSFVTSLGAAVQSITFTDPGTKTTATPTFTLSATNTSGQTVKFTSNDTDVCTVDGATVTIVNTGTCTIIAFSGEATISGTKWFFPSGAKVTRNIPITAAVPVVSTGAASEVKTTSVSLAGSVNASLGSTTVSFEYSTSSGFATSTSASGGTVTGATTTAVSASVSGLQPGTKYWFRVKATNSAGTSTGDAASFTTRGSAPTAATGSTSSVSSSRATLNGVVNPGEMETSVWFTIGQKSDLSDGTKIEYRSVTGSTDTDVSVTATGLSESTRYYYRVEASNVLGSAKGDIKSFTASRPVGITINDAAEFTNSRRVTVYATGQSGSTQVILSNDGGFGSSQTFDLVDGYAEIPWTLVASRDERLPKTVYARFVQRFGSQSSTNTDDIILDTTAPVMTGATGASTASSPSNVTAAAAKKGGVKMTVRARDANSGIGKVQVKTSANGRITDVPTTSPKASTRTVRVNTTKKRLWVRVVDRAGNVSRWVTVTVK